MTETRAGAFLMAYGAPATLDDVADYFTHIRGGRRPPDERIEELKERYRLIGDPAGLLRITEEQVRAVQQALDGDGGEPVLVTVGMRHSPPWIADRAREIAGTGIDRLVGLVLAPHYSALSVGRYQSALREAMDGAGASPRLLMVDHYGDDPGYLAAVAEALREVLGQAAELGVEDPHVLFTAHSLPARILEAGDPYKDQVEATARLAAASAGIERWEVAFQSASPTGEPWLGPDFMDRISDLASQGVRDVVIAPVGFVSDHLEILYDVDILAKEHAEKAGCRLWRLPSMNTRPGFIDALAGIIRKTLEAAAGS